MFSHTPAFCTHTCSYTRKRLWHMDPLSTNTSKALTHRRCLCNLWYTNACIHKGCTHKAVIHRHPNFSTQRSYTHNSLHPQTLLHTTPLARLEKHKPIRRGQFYMQILYIHRTAVVQKLFCTDAFAHTQRHTQEKRCILVCAISNERGATNRASCHRCHVQGLQETTQHVRFDFAFVRSICRVKQSRQTPQMLCCHSSAWWRGDTSSNSKPIRTSCYGFARWTCISCEEVAVNNWTTEAAGFAAAWRHQRSCREGCVLRASIRTLLPPWEKHLHAICKKIAVSAFYTCICTPACIHLHLCTCIGQAAGVLRICTCTPGDNYIYI